MEKKFENHKQDSNSKFYDNRSRQLPERQQKPNDPGPKLPKKGDKK